MASGCEQRWSKVGRRGVCLHQEMQRLRQHYQSRMLNEVQAVDLQDKDLDNELNIHGLGHTHRRYISGYVADSELLFLALDMSLWLCGQKFRVDSFVMHSMYSLRWSSKPFPLLKNCFWTTNTL